MGVAHHAEWRAVCQLCRYQNHSRPIVSKARAFTGTCAKWLLQAPQLHSKAKLADTQTPPPPRQQQAPLDQAEEVYSPPEASKAPECSRWIDISGGV
mmetsp:Transcript_86575/g.163183  ORF Transcript_86575/g.163183 Transcript_86575/m.163183 type:complete len:97 (+) Transcript_86575:765-1055(+)